MIKFIVAEEKQEKQLTLRDVKENQFFVDSEGRLCQKVGADCYNTITDGMGIPFAYEVFCKSNCLIERILSEVKRIEF